MKFLSTFLIALAITFLLSCNNTGNGNNNSSDTNTEAGTNDTVNKNYIDPSTTPANTTTVSPDGEYSPRQSEDSIPEYNPVADRNNNDNSVKPK